MASYITQQTYDGFCNLERRIKTVIGDRHALETDSMKVISRLAFSVSYLASGIVFPYGVTVGMGQLTDFSCTGTSKTALLIGGIFLIGLPLPFIIAWINLGLNYRMAAFELVHLNNLKDDMEICKQELHNPSLRMKRDDDVMVSIEELKERIDYATKGLQPLNFNVYYCYYFLILALSFVTSIGMPYAFYYIHFHVVCKGFPLAASALALPLLYLFVLPVSRGFPRVATALGLPLLYLYVFPAVSGGLPWAGALALPLAVVLILSVWPFSHSAT